MPSMKQYFYILLGIGILKYAHYSYINEQISIRASEIVKAESPMLFFFVWLAILLVGLFLVVIPCIPDKLYDKIMGEDDSL
ncbi:MAG: hypothetical protein CL578_10685 [Alteromonadaceae bacterium]|nr:hypothetical protein [Alteromonadaceae bacterium]|tara:strand:+ start:1661 stop:1903 length:243 start_codon:yes stop_codon:yes gene_type:complete